MPEKTNTIKGPILVMIRKTPRRAPYFWRGEKGGVVSKDGLDCDAWGEEGRRKVPEPILTRDAREYTAPGESGTQGNGN